MRTRFQASEADIAAATPRYETEMNRRFRGGGAETVSATNLPVSIGGASRIMAGSRWLPIRCIGKRLYAT